MGFLLLKPMTGYELKAMMDMTIGHFNRPSYGGIYPSLKKLAHGGYVSMAQSVAGGKIRKTYKPIPAGKKAFLSWLKEPPDITRGPGPLLTKIFFLGLGDRENAKAFSREVRRAACERVEWLKRMAAEYQSMADAYQVSTCRFGIDYYLFLEKWFVHWEAGI
ncbi:MAG: PadR family transcriptional regulator [Anaerolineales bacterium]